MDHPRSRPRFLVVRRGDDNLSGSQSFRASDYVYLYQPHHSESAHPRHTKGTPARHIMDYGPCSLVLQQSCRALGSALISLIFLRYLFGCTLYEKLLNGQGGSDLGLSGRKDRLALNRREKRKVSIWVSQR